MPRWSVKLTKPVAYRLCCLGDINKNRKKEVEGEGGVVAGRRNITDLSY